MEIKLKYLSNGHSISLDSSDSSMQFRIRWITTDLKQESLGNKDSKRMIVCTLTGETKFVAEGEKVDLVDLHHDTPFDEVVRVLAGSESNTVAAEWLSEEEQISMLEATRIVEEWTQ